jgi:hypothetical protein
MRFDPGLTVGPDPLEIRVRGLSGHGWFALAALDDDTLPLSAVDLFMQQVDRWNLEHTDGRSVPVTSAAFMDHDLEFIKTVTAAWIREVLPAPYPAAPPVEEEEPDLSLLADLSQPVPADV